MSCLQATEVHQHFSQHGLNAVPHLVHCIATTPDQHHGTKQHNKPAASGNGPGSNGGNHHRGAAQSSLSMYNLEVVSRNQLPASYCTISATGVVQVSPPEPVDSCSLQHRYCEKTRLACPPTSVIFTCKLCGSSNQQIAAAAVTCICYALDVCMCHAGHMQVHPLMKVFLSVC
jgi:hypothetical protein